VDIFMDDGATEFYRVTAPAFQTANATVRYTMGPFGTLTAGANNASVVIPTPADLVLQAGFRIRTATAAMQVGDNYGPPVLYVAEYQVRGLERAVERYEREVAQAVAAPG
jgi:hypothetical protein